MAKSKPVKKVAGRPTKFSENLATDIVLRIRGGGTPERIANAVGIGVRTFYTWMSQGEEGIEPFVTFRQDVIRARDTAILTAEMEVKRTNPLAYLRMSPNARGDSEMPGWGDATEIEEAESVFDATEDELFEELMARLDKMAERDAIASTTEEPQ